MPYVVGTYHDKRGSMDCLLSGENETVQKCRASVRWQSGSTGQPCTNPRDEHDLRTEWHIADPAPASPFVMVCRCCGTELHIERGGFTWETFHQVARAIWGAAIPLTVAELRLSRTEH